MPKSKSRTTTDFERRNPHRRQAPRMLIVCEGETEEDYCNDYRRHFRLSATDVRVEVAGVPLTVVHKAKELHDKEPYQHVWCLFDCDEHPGFVEAILLAKNLGFEVAWSNPCFEIWFLFHWMEHTAHIERDKAARKVEQKLSSWKKGVGLFTELFPHQPEAIDRARKSRERHKAKQDPKNYPEHSNPSTRMDCLVEFLNKVGAQNK